MTTIAKGLYVTAGAHGGSEAHDAQDHGFMYERAFHDPDGHGGGPFWFDPAAEPGA